MHSINTFANEILGVETEKQETIIVTNWSII